MSITIEIDEDLAQKIDSAAKTFSKGRAEYISDVLQKPPRRDLRKSRYSDEEVSAMYQRANVGFPVKEDEFEIEDSQLEGFWEKI